MRQKLKINIWATAITVPACPLASFNSILIQPSYNQSVFKKYLFNLSFLTVKGRLLILNIRWARVRCFFYDWISLTSFFTCQGNQYMSNKTVIELQLGEKFQLDESSSMIVHSVKDYETVRLAFNAPKHVKIFTERTYRKLLNEFYLERKLKKGEIEPC